MKSGKYTVEFNVNLTDCEDEDQAREALKKMFNDMLDNDELPQMGFDLVEEIDPEYATEEYNNEELNFG